MGRRFAVGALAAVLGAVAAFVSAAGPAAAQQREEIVSYDVVLDVRDGNRMEVTEEITVRSLGQQIRRGIYRDFPTTFPTFAGLGRIEAPFEVLEVRRDGSSEPWALERIGGPWGRAGVRVRIGDADVFLDDGLHTYTIRYATERWMAFGDEADELYWNVTGNGWDFPILEASARVVFPRDADPAAVELTAWTGPEGATASDATAAWDAALGEAFFETTRPLGPREGLTISVLLPTGVVQPPSEAERRNWFWIDWGSYVQAAVGVLLVIATYLVMWWRVGRDPPEAPVVVRYAPPEGYSPAALGYLDERGWRDRFLAATVVSLGVKGGLRIQRDEKDDEWTLRRNGDGPPAGAAAEERRLWDDLLKSRKSLTLDRSRSTILRSAVSRLRTSLKARLERDYFEENRTYFFAGLGISVFTLVVLSWLDPYGVPFPAWFLMFWLSMWTIGAGTLFIRCLGAWRDAFTGGGPGSWLGAIVMTAFSTPFFIAEIVVAGVLLAMVPRALALAAVALGLVNVSFYHLLERPTLKGRRVLDELEGFRRFLTAADADRLDRLNAPDRTPELFEAYLPHAIALGVENRWAESFEGALDVAPEATSSSTTSSLSGAGSAMRWYTAGGAAGFTGLASSLGSSFSSSLSSASSPPPSSGSSGGGFSSSGGGSSGGGGGGGGGGGW